MKDPVEITDRLVADGWSVTVSLQRGGGSAAAIFLGVKSVASTDDVLTVSTERGLATLMNDLAAAVARKAPRSYFGRWYAPEAIGLKNPGRVMTEGESSVDRPGRVRKD